MSFGASYPLLNNVLHIPSTRQPLDIRSTITYLLPPCLSYIVVAILVILPGTRTLRIAVWPLIAILAFRAAVYVDLSNGDPKNTFRNVQLELMMFIVAIRTQEWSFSKEPLKRHLRPINSTPSLVMDALDLATNVRGIGWSWSKGVYVPPETRPTSSRTAFCSYVLLSAVVHGFIHGILHMAMQAFSPEMTTVPGGGTIFDASLPPFIRYVRSTIIAVAVALGISFLSQFSYSICTLIGVAVFRQDPTQWPPVIQAPWLATSVRDFWSRRWHQLFRRNFIVLGGWPLSIFFGNLGYIFGSFLASGLFHYIFVLMFNGSTGMWCMVFSFWMMAVGIVLENAFRSLTGHRIGGWKGWLWTMAWLLV